LLIRSSRRPFDDGAAVGHVLCTRISMGDEPPWGQVCSQLSDTLTELRTISRRLQDFDGTVAAVNLRGELGRLRRYLDTLSDTIAIVVQHLPPVARADPP
jgi:hypothetical protein